MVKGDNDGRGKQHSPITIERQERQRAEYMEMGFNATPSQMDKQGRGKHLGYGDSVASNGAAGVLPDHENGKTADGAAQKNGGQASSHEN